MNKKILFFGWLVASIMMAGPAMSGEMRMIKVDLGYSGTAVSYNLYKNGVQVCSSSVPGATQMDCNVEIDATPMTFALTAVDANGFETPQSAPYILQPPSTVPANDIVATGGSMSKPTVIRAWVK